MSPLALGRLARLLNVLEERDGCGHVGFFLGDDSAHRIDGEYAADLWTNLADRERDEYRADAAKLATWLETGDRS